MPQTAQSVSSENQEPEPQKAGLAGPPIPKNRPWFRMDGEPSLWWRRFQQYRDFGPKRSLQKIFEQERASISVLSGTNDKKRNPHKAASKQLAEVPKQIVPGSWKLASKTWNWFARARAWDEYVIDRVVEGRLNQMIAGLSQKTNRVHMLKTMAETLGKNYNVNHNNMTYEQECAMIARIQALLKDIRDEMSDFDEAMVRVLVRRDVANGFEKLTEQEYQENFGREQKKR